MQSFWRSFLSIINACKDHGIPYYIMQHNAKWQFENAINIVFLFLLSICPCPVAVKQFPDQCWMTSWRISSMANMTIICPFPIMTLPTQVLSLLLLISCGFFLWQPTVISSFRKILFLVSVQAGQDGIDSKPILYGDCLDEKFVKVVPSTWVAAYSTARSSLWWFLPILVREHNERVSLLKFGVPHHSEVR